MKVIVLLIGVMVILSGSVVADSGVPQTFTGNNIEEALSQRGNSLFMEADHHEDAVNLPEGDVLPYEGDALEDPEKGNVEEGDIRDEDAEELEDDREVQEESGSDRI